MLGPLVINGIVWRVVLVDPDDPRLVDRTGSTCMATTDPHKTCVYLSRLVRCELLDHVLLHEATHCLLLSYGIDVPDTDRWYLEEWLCNFVGSHSREILQAVDQALPRHVGYMCCCPAWYY